MNGMKKVSSDDNEMVEVKVLMALAEENDAASKEGATNGELVKISMRKVHTLLEIKDNDDRKVCNTPKIRSQRKGNNGVLHQSTKIKILKTTLNGR
ncbi:hypothetical protein Tco_0501214 [Tanacetum coccineum]